MYDRRAAHGQLQQAWQGRRTRAQCGLLQRFETAVSAPEREMRRDATRAPGRRRDRCSSRLSTHSGHAGRRSAAADQHGAAALPRRSSRKAAPRGIMRLRCLVRDARSRRHCWPKCAASIAPLSTPAMVRTARAAQVSRAPRVRSWEAPNARPTCWRATQKSRSPMVFDRSQQRTCTCFERGHRRARAARWDHKAALPACRHNSSTRGSSHAADRCEKRVVGRWNVEREAAPSVR